MGVVNKNTTNSKRKLLHGILLSYLVQVYHEFVFDFSVLKRKTSALLSDLSLSEFNSTKRNMTKFCDMKIKIKARSSLKLLLKKDYTLYSSQIYKFWPNIIFYTNFNTLFLIFWSKQVSVCQTRRNVPFNLFSLVANL